MLLRVCVGPFLQTVMALGLPRLLSSSWVSSFSTLGAAAVEWRSGWCCCCWCRMKQLHS